DVRLEERRSLCRLRQSAADAHPPTECPRQVRRSISCSVGLLRLDSPESSADLLGERNEDALRATDITEPIAVPIPVGAPLAARCARRDARAGTTRARRWRPAALRRSRTSGRRTA